MKVRPIWRSGKGGRICFVLPAESRLPMAPCSVSSAAPSRRSLCRVPLLDSPLYRLRQQQRARFKLLRWGKGCLLGMGPSLLLEGRLLLLLEGRLLLLEGRLLLLLGGRLLLLEGRLLLLLEGRLLLLEGRPLPLLGGRLLLLLGGRRRSLCRPRPRRR